MTHQANSQQPIAIINGVILTPHRRIDRGSLLIEGGKISAVSSDAVNLPSDTRMLDAEGLFVAPGLIDLHTHGMLGHDNMGSALFETIKAYPSVGVTSFLATTMTAPFDDILSRLKDMAAVLDNPPGGANCIGIHLEGPHLSPEQPGMANAEWFRPFTMADYDQYQQAASGRIVRITLAPESVQRMEDIPAILEDGVNLSAGHSNATYEQMLSAIQSGVRQTTHTFNAMPALHHRSPGLLGAALLNSEVFTEVIADGHHIHPAVLHLLVKLKSPERVLLVSDSAPMAGLPDGRYEWSETQIIVHKGRCQLEDGTLAGGHRSLDAGVRTMVNEVGLPLERGLAMATSSPANAMNWQSKGEIRAGMDADIVMLDQELRAVRTIVQGKISWTREGLSDRAQGSTRV